jgi:type VI protein secretion system component VasK
MENKSTKPKRSKLRIALGILAAVVIVALAATVVILWQQNATLRDTDQAVAEQAQQLKDKVSLLMEVPDETPVIATVSAVEELRDQPFFKKAENGDKVLIFSAEKKAVIYRESTNKIINSGPIAVTSDDSGNVKTED